MSRANLSARELRLLTAYLDGELPAGEAARVAQRVANDPAWQEAYAHMRAVKQGLRALPRERAPRAFTLRAADAAARRPARARWGYRWASAAALMLLLLVFAGDFLSHHMLLAATSAPPQALSAAPVEQPAAASAKAAEAAVGAGTPTPSARGEAFGPARAEENALDATTSAPAATPTPTPTMPSTPSAATAPAPPSPSPWGWRLVEGVLACLTVVLAFLGWRR